MRNPTLSRIAYSSKTSSYIWLDIYDTPLRSKVMGVKNPIMKILSLVYCLPLFLVILCTSTVTGLMATPTNTTPNTTLHKTGVPKPSKDFLTPDYKGMAYLDVGNYTGAIPYFDEALAINPNYSLTLNNKGAALYGLGIYNESIAYFDKALSVNPYYTIALYNKGAALSKLGLYNESIVYFDKILAIQPTNALALAGKKLDVAAFSKTNIIAKPTGTTNIHSNGKTTVPLSKAVGGKPSDDVLMLNKKGVALLILGNFNESIVYFDKALAINPKSLENLDNKGDALLNLGKYKEAIAYFDKVLALDPNYFLSLYNKGAALNKLGKYSESIAYFDKALALKPTSRHALAGKKMVVAEIRSELSSIPQDPSMFGYYFGSNIPGQPPKNATSAK